MAWLRDQAESADKGFSRCTALLHLRGIEYGMYGWWKRLSWREAELPQR